jgi:hypothetical protein
MPARNTTEWPTRSFQKPAPRLAKQLITGQQFRFAKIVEWIVNMVHHQSIVSSFICRKN